MRILPLKITRKTFSVAAIANNTMVDPDISIQTTAVHDFAVGEFVNISGLTGSALVDGDWYVIEVFESDPGNSGIDSFKISATAGGAALAADDDTYISGGTITLNNPIPFSATGQPARYVRVEQEASQTAEAFVGGPALDSSTKADLFKQLAAYKAGPPDILDFYEAGVPDGGPGNQLHLDKLYAEIQTAGDSLVGFALIG